MKGTGAASIPRSRWERASRVGAPSLGSTACFAHRYHHTHVKGGDMPMWRLSRLGSTLSLAPQYAVSWLHARLLTRRPAQGLVEYGLILVLIMVVCVAILTAVGQTLSNVWYTKLIPAFP